VFLVQYIDGFQIVSSNCEFISYQYFASFVDLPVFTFWDQKLSDALNEHCPKTQATIESVVSSLVPLLWLEDDVIMDLPNDCEQK
jgi:hypothetical protein